LSRAISLVEKISGPNAVPLSALIEKAEIAAQRVHQTFGDFLEHRIQELGKRRGELAHGTGWKEFYATVVDLRGSAAMAGQAAVQMICVSLEGLLKERVHDARTCAVVASHIDALVLVSSQRKPNSGAVELLIEELEQAVAHIPLRPV
jgi:hypothetical protein